MAGLIFAEDLTEGTVFLLGSGSDDSAGPRTVVSVGPAIDPSKLNVRFWVSVEGNDHQMIFDRDRVLEHVGGPLAAG